MNILEKQSPNHQQQQQQPPSQQQQQTAASQSGSSNNSNNNNSNNNNGNNNNGQSTGPNGTGVGSTGSGAGPPPPPPVSVPCSSTSSSSAVVPGPPSTPLTPSSNNDCMIPNSQLIPSMSAPSASSGTGGGPSSVSSSSAPHTPLDGINIAMNNANNDGSMPSNGLCSTSNRPNVSTPSSVFNNSAPNTPMPCPSVGSDVANITSPALNPMVGDYGPTGTTPVSQSPFANNQTNSANNNNPNLLPSPLSVHQQTSSICQENVINQHNNKNKPISNGSNGTTGVGANKKHCNNRNQNNVANQNVNNGNNNNNNNYVPQQMNMNNNCAGMQACGVAGPPLPPNAGPPSQPPPPGHSPMPGDNMTKQQQNQMNFSMTPPHNNQMPCMQNGMPLNGSMSPFDDCKMNNFSKEFIPNLNETCAGPPPMPNSCAPRMTNCSVGPPMNSMAPSNMMNPVGPNKMCGTPNMIPNAPIPPPPPNMKNPPMDGQFMQHQNQVFVFNTMLANHAAEAVDQGHCPSIIHFHMNHPQTKKFIEKNSIKLQNFNRQNNAWMGNIRQPRIRGPNSHNGMPLRGNFNNPCFSPYNHNPPGPGPGGGSPGPGQWNPNWHGPNNHMSGFPPNDMKMNCGNSGIRQCGPQQYNNFNPQSYPMGCNDAIPDDNLTPQQKQHREDKLAILANLQQKFLQQDLIEPNNRLPPVSAQSSQPPNDFVPMDPMTSANSNHSMYPDQMAIKQDADQINQPPSMNPSDMNFNSNFCPNPMMNNHPNNEQWLKSSGPNFPIEETKPFTNGRRKGSQNANHQSPISQPSVNSPNSCINQSPSNRVPPPPYNRSMSMSSPHPGSPAALSLPSPRMPATTDTRQPNYTPVRSGPSTPSADANCGGPPLINSPKSSSQRTNSSPGNKKNKQQQPPPSSIDNDLNMFSKTEHSLMPVPSPQQIDYINTFEGQELTIQKQPNAHFQESNDLMGLNNDLFPNDFNMCPPVNNPMDMNQNNQRFPNTSQPCNFDGRYQDNMRFNGNNGPMDNYRPPHMCGPQFNQNDPNMRFPNCDMKPRMSGPTDMEPFPSSNSICDMNFNNSIPPINDGSFANGSNHGFNDPTDNPISSTHLQNLQKMAPPFDMAPNSKQMGPNMMSGPNNNQMMPGPNAKSPRMQGNYDQAPFGPGLMGNMAPCSDMNEQNNYGGPPPHMAQSNMPMNYPNNFSNSPQMPSNPMIPAGNDPQYGGMHPNNSFSPMPPMNAPTPHSIIDQNSPNGPSPMPMMPMGSGPPPPPAQGNFPPRLPPANVNRPPMNPSNSHGPRYNSPNIQVKPDAPNTIQYLPSRPQGPTTTPPNKPPNLDFLQQSLNMGNNKSTPQPNTYYPPNNSGSIPPNRPNMNFGPRGPMMRPQNMNNATTAAPGNMCPTGSNDMFTRPPGNHMTNGPNQMPPPPPNTNFGNGPPPTSSTATGAPGNGPIPPPTGTSPVPTNKPPPPGATATSAAGNSGPVLHPDASFNFNKSSFNSLPSTSDPNYAAQFHNFQQQLYATNTRNSNNPRMNSNF